MNYGVWDEAKVFPSCLRIPPLVQAVLAMTGRRNFTSGSLDALLPLLSDTSANIKRSVARAFASVGTIEDRRVIDTLFKSLGDADWVIRGMSSSALAST